MKIELLINPINGKNEVLELTWKGEKLTLSMAYFDVRRLRTDFEIFAELQHYWNTLPDSTLDELFNIYKDMYYVLNANSDRESIMKHLKILITKMLNIYDLDHVCVFITSKSNISIPNIFLTHYDHDENIFFTRNKTFLKHEYIELVGVCLILRTVAPILGMFIDTIQNSISKKLKEFYAFQLLLDSNLFNSSIYDKLYEYIEITTTGILKREPIFIAKILEGLPSDDYLDFIVSLIVVKRLCLINLRGTDEKHIVKTLYSTLKQEIDNIDKSEKSITDKEDIQFSSDGEGTEISPLEKYKMKGNLSPGDEVEINWALEDPYNVCKHLYPNIDKDLLELCLATTNQLLDYPILLPQITLLKGIITPYISPHSIDYVYKNTIVQLLGMSQAILWQRDHKYLALLITSYAQNINIVNNDSKDRLTKVNSEFLNSKYLLVRDKNIKNNTTSKGEVKISNPAIESLDYLANTILSYPWRMTADRKLIDSYYVNQNCILLPSNKGIINTLVNYCNDFIF